ncbi:putative adenylosuccinate lyase [Cardiosporidium cionae]|uniref:Adenylosuccinate lyase n=1 Tax=Cardiosporidium cionae TaxID=476202 RepID=A0ABQ7JC75_9APIC|nr:putative adenylosuccinate lyase [Cardiosporidium cionae]|eukprot:KAF8821612.1 putative adenylosuccinate lyase [Cardiosporidium cionae]
MSSNNQRTDAALEAISPLDGRYASKCEECRRYFSEYALIRHRVFVELQWYLLLAECPDIPQVGPFSNETIDVVKNLENVTLEQAQQVKNYEKITNHDVKAIEYYIKERLEETGLLELQKSKEFIHFCCTSEDINNLAYAKLLKNSMENLLRPAMISVVEKICELAVKYADVPLLSRTHGQAATPTTFGKEMANFAARMRRFIVRDVDQVEYLGKFNGAVGNFNAHLVAYPALNWPLIAKKFVEERLGLTYQMYSTQIECHDYIAELVDSICRFNTCLLDFNMDMWTYISRDHLLMQPVAGEVGSSTMPHKVNPIDFENSEGNLGLSNAVLKFLSGKLPISRLQRDLSDSTTLRNIGVGFTHAYLAYKSVLRGLGKIAVNAPNMATELDGNWAVLAEPIQTVMRKGGLPLPYEQLKDFTRGQHVDQHGMREFILKNCKELPEEDLARLLQLTPGNYIGMATVLAKEIGKY